MARMEGDEPAITPGAIRFDSAAILSLKRSDQSEWQLRTDVRRAIIYEQSVDSRSILRLGVLHPIQAIILASFDGRRELAEIAREIAVAFDLSADDAQSLVRNTSLRWAEALETGPQPHASKYCPLDFIVSAAEIDLTSRRLYKPLSLICHVSDDCMRRCIYCNIEKRKTKELKLLPLSRWESLADECRDLGIASVILGGGDPFMRRDVLDIIGAFVRRGIQPFVSTKSMVTRQTAFALASLGLKWIQVSLDSPRPDTANFLTGSSTYFPQVVASIRHLVAAGLHVRTNTVVTKHNVHQVPSLVKMLWDLGVEVVRTSPVGRSLFVPNTEELLLDANDSDWLTLEIDKLKSQGDVTFGKATDMMSVPLEVKEAMFRKRARCTAGRWAFVMHSDGKVTLCDEIPLLPDFIVGDLSRQSIMEVWNAKRIEELIYPARSLFRGRACFSCDTFDECHSGAGRCFRDALKAYGTFYSPMPACPKAPVGARLV